MRTKISAPVRMPKWKWTLEVVAIEDIDEQPTQPDIRTGDAQIRELIDKIREIGLVVPPVLVRKETRFTSLDGHRRISASAELGVTHLQCLVLVDVTAAKRDEFFFLANCFTRPLHGNERVQAWAKTPPSRRDVVLESMTSGQAKQIRGACSILGNDVVAELALENKALSSCAKNVKAVISWCDAWGHEKPSPRSIARWIIKYKAARLVDTVARHAGAKTTAAIVNAIRTDRRYDGPAW